MYGGAKEISFANCTYPFPFKSPVITPAGWAREEKESIQMIIEKSKPSLFFPGAGKEGKHQLWQKYGISSINLMSPHSRTTSSGQLQGLSL